MPHLWLFTDERVADAMLLRAITRLPRGSGVVLRHYRLDRMARRALYEQVRAIARRRGLVLLIGGEGRETRGWRADGRHATGQRGADGRKREGKRGILSAPVHDMREMAAANRRGVDLVCLSPIFPTRSHPGAAALGPMRFASLARLSRAPVIALGGMTAKRFGRVKPLGAYGWAGIDALVGMG